MKESTGIYGIYNTDNGKMYIGKGELRCDGWGMSKRIYLHYSDLSNNNHGNKYLQRAFNAGQELMPILIYEIANGKIVSHDSIFRLEKHFIAEYETFTDRSKGYNLTAGGDGAGSGKDNHFYGRTHTEETKKKISEKKLNPSDETRHKINKAALKQWADPTKRAVLVEARKRQWADPENRKKNSNKMKKQWSDPENRKKAISRLKEYWAEPENRKKLIGRTCAEETRRKLREANLGKRHTEKTKQKCREANLGRFAGEKNLTSKLKKEEVFLIKHYLLPAGIKQKLIGKMFGVSNSTVCMISKGKRWSHI